jgi:hypothetical protein
MGNAGKDTANQLLPRPAHSQSHPCPGFYRPPVQGFQFAASPLNWGLPRMFGNGERLFRFMDWMRDLRIVKTFH